MFHVRACVVGARRITSSTTISVTTLHGLTIRSLSSCSNAKVLMTSSSSLLTVHQQPHPCHHFISSRLNSETNAIRRSFSTDNNDDNKNDNNNKEGEVSSESDDASFFLDNDESKLNPPPSYVRDSITGKWTSETHAEISVEDKRLLKLDESSKSEELMNRLDVRWTNAAKEAEAAVEEEGDSGGSTGSSDFFGTLNKEHERVAHRIQEEQLAMGPIGRNPADSVKSRGSASEKNEDEESSSTTTSKPLTPNEYQALKAYAKKEYDIQPREFDKLSKDADGENLIPIHDLSSGSEGLSDSKQFFDADLDLAYLNPRLSRRAFKDEGDQRDDPFADLLPSDLNPARKVNRRNAKPIPKRLLHHNNLSLLRRYTTPGGKIMNRVQSRLGAKDQRKIAKLVKRARHLGLIPHLGQWKYEDHGNLYEDGLQESVSTDESSDKGKRDWEIELEKRGLWPLQNETELIKRYYDMDKIMNHLAPTPKKRAELEQLLGGPGALVGDESNTELAEGGDKKQQE